MPDFIKIDVDGAEAAVLRGGQKLLQEHRPHIIVESHSLALEQECLTFLQMCGYQPRVIDQRKLLRDYRPIPHNRWLVAEGDWSRSGKRGSAARASPK